MSTDSYEVHSDEYQTKYHPAPSGYASSINVKPLKSSSAQHIHHYDNPIHELPAIYEHSQTHNSYAPSDHHSQPLKHKYSVKKKSGSYDFD